MSKEQIIAAVLAATPAKCRELEAVLNGAATAKKPEKEKENDGPRLVSISGAARFLSVSRSSVYALIEQGRIDVVELSGSSKVTMRSLRAFLDGQRPPNAKTAEAVAAHAKRYAATQRLEARA